MLLGSNTYGSASLTTHELGHALGFRHEFARPEFSGCSESNDYRALTAYDDVSVMHYLSFATCGGSASDTRKKASDRGH